MGVCFLPLALYNLDTMKRLFLLSSVLLFFALTGNTQNQLYFPSKNGIWAEKSPAEVSINSQKLQEAVDFAEAHEYAGSKDLRQAILKGFEREPFHEILGPTKKRGGPAGMILKNGYIISQWGDVKRVDMTFSVTKSYLSTLVGVGLTLQKVPGINDPVGEVVWSGEFDGDHNSKITWEHLLTQSSDWSGSLWGGKDWADRPPQKGGLDDWKNRTLKEPGTSFEYNDVRVNLLAYSLLNVWRKPLPQVLKDEIMDPIGASDTWRWYGYENSWVDIDGQMMQSVSGGGHSGGGLFISTEDHARFGLLMMNNGKWKNENLFDGKWMQLATRPSKANNNYGYMWWLNTPGNRYMEKLPEHLYYAAGFGGNYIVIDEKENLVIVTRWLDPPSFEAFLEKVYQAF